VLAYKVYGAGRYRQIYRKTGAYMPNMPGMRLKPKRALRSNGAFVLLVKGLSLFARAATAFNTGANKLFIIFIMIQLLYYYDNFLQDVSNMVPFVKLFVFFNHEDRKGKIQRIL